MVNTAAATQMRMVAAAAGVHPARIRLVANDPEVPKVADEAMASPRPAFVFTSTSL
jgi:hypothetical protein